MTALTTNPAEVCMKDQYELAKDHWYHEVWTPYIAWFEYVPILRRFGYWKKIYWEHWSEFYCWKHKRGHKKK